MSTGKCYACGTVGEIGVTRFPNGACFSLQACRIRELEKNDERVRTIFKILDGAPEKEECIDEVKE